MSKESWLGYCYYLKEWAENHRSTVFEGCSPVGYEGWLEYEAQSQPAERYKLVSVDAIAYDDDWMWNNVAEIGIFTIAVNIDHADFLLHCVEKDQRDHYTVVEYDEDCYELQDITNNYRPVLALVPLV